MKTTFIHYSFEGNCRELSLTMAAAAGGDALAIRPREEVSRNPVMKYLGGGKGSILKETPELEPYGDGWRDSDLVFVGGPVWAFNMAPPIRSFLSREDWSGRRVALFAMHRGGPGSALSAMRGLVEGRGGEVVGAATFMDLRRGDVGKTKSEAVRWALELVDTGNR